MSARKYPKFGTIGYIVGYDGQIPGGETPKGKYVLPIGGLQAVANVHKTEQEALDELDGKDVYKEATLLGTRSYVLRVHHIKLSWFPFAEGHLGYRKLKTAV